MDNEQSNYLELDLAWKKMAEEKFSTNKINKQEIMDAIKSNSNSTIQVLKKRLKTKMLQSIIPLLFIGLAVFLGVWSGPLAFWIPLVLTGIMFLSIALLYNKYRQMDDGIIESKSVLENLKHNAGTIRSMLYTERIWSIIIGAAIFIYLVFSNDSYGTTTTSFIIYTIITAIIIIALTFWNEAENKKKFGVKLKEMEDNIIRLETLS